MAHKPFGNTKVCCINYCTNSSRNSSYNFQAFPVKKPLLAKWLQLIDRDKHIKPNWIPYFLKYGFICDIHFRNKELSSNLPTENLDLAPKPSGFMITEVFSISEAANGSGLLPVTIKQEPNLEIEDLLPNIKSEVVEIQREIVEDAGSSKSNPDSIAGFQGYVPAYSVYVACYPNCE